ncbi:MAG: hypothetical protein IJN50_02165 [Clostridia bacterium]|nr:hypothetical protein [Clostridia bacterium]
MKLSEKSQTNREFIASCHPLLFRPVQKIIHLDKTHVSKCIGCSWPTLDKNLKKIDTLKSVDDCFYGIYICNSKIQSCIIDLYGNIIANKQLDFDSSKELNITSITGVLENIDYTKLRGLAISSDNYYSDNAFSSTNRSHLFLLSPPTYLDDLALSEIIPSECHFSLTKTNFANCIVQSELEYESLLNKRSEKIDETIVVISYNNNEVLSTILYRGKVIKKCSNLTHFSFDIDNSKDFGENFFERYLLPHWITCSPDKFVFFSNNEKDLFNLSTHFPLWRQLFVRSYQPHAITKIFIPALEINKTTPAESTALYSMYAYYGWEF